MLAIGTGAARIHIVVLLLVGSVCCCWGQWSGWPSEEIPMSPCMWGRITNYNYLTNQNGACHFGPLGGPMMAGFTNVAAPNQAFFAGSMRCGECYEVIGPTGNTTVMVVDECPSEGNPLCQGDMNHFDLGTSNTFATLATPTSLGVVLTTIRQVACPVSGNIGLYLIPGSSEWWVGIVLYNHRIGVTNLEIQPNSNSGWFNMTRNSNIWGYQTVGGVPLSLPYNVRITGQTGEQLEFAMTSFTAGTNVTSNVQFSDPPEGFDGADNETNCYPPPPPDTIYTDELFNGGGASTNAWNDWSWGTTNNWQCTDNPFEGDYCLCSEIDAHGGIQLGRMLPIHWKGWFTDLYFAARASSDYNDLTVWWATVTPVSLTLTTEWQEFHISLAGQLNSPSGVGNAPYTLEFVNSAGSPAPTIYLDQIVFTPPNNVTWPSNGVPSGGAGGSNQASTPSGFVLSGLDRVKRRVIL